MHCCAAAEHQFESFRKIPGFYAFNRSKARRGYAPILDHFQGSDAPVHALANLEDEEVAALLAGAEPETRFIFCHSADDLSDARSWLDRMGDMDGFHQSADGFNGASLGTRRSEDAPR